MSVACVRAGAIRTPPPFGARANRYLKSTPGQQGAPNRLHGTGGVPYSHIHSLNRSVSDWYAGGEANTKSAPRSATVESWSNWSDRVVGAIDRHILTDDGTPMRELARMHQEWQLQRMESKTEGKQSMEFIYSKLLQEKVWTFGAFLNFSLVMREHLKAAIPFLDQDSPQLGLYEGHIKVLEKMTPQMLASNSREYIHPDVYPLLAEAAGVEGQAVYDTLQQHDQLRTARLYLITLKGLNRPLPPSFTDLSSQLSYDFKQEAHSPDVVEAQRKASSQFSIPDTVLRDRAKEPTGRYDPKWRTKLMHEPPTGSPFPAYGSRWSTRKPSNDAPEARKYRYFLPNWRPRVHKMLRDPTLVYRAGDTPRPGEDWAIGGERHLEEVKKRAG